MDTIGERIKQARLNKGWTQDDLAVAAQITSAAVSRYENGQRQPRLEHLQAIANALGVSTFELTTFSPEKKAELERANQKLLHIIDSIAKRSDCSPQDIEAFERVKEIIEEGLNQSLTLEYVKTKAQSDAEAKATKEEKERQVQARMENKAEKRKQRQIEQLVSAFSSLSEDNKQKVLDRVAELTALQSIQEK